MDGDTTLNLPDDLVRRAADYAARHGTTVSALVRDHLERVAGRDGVPERDDALLAFSEGRMGKDAAIAALGLRDHAQLLLALGDRGLPLPRLPDDEVEAMTETFVRLRGGVR